MKPSRDYGTVERRFMFVAHQMTKSEIAVMEELVAASGFTGVAHRKQAALAKRLGIGKRTVERAYAKLTALDLIAVSGHGCVLINPRYWFKGDGKHFAFREKDYLDARAGKWIPALAEAVEASRTDMAAE